MIIELAIIFYGIILVDLAYRINKVMRQNRRFLKQNERLIKTVNRLTDEIISEEKKTSQVEIKIKKGGEAKRKAKKI